MKLIKYSAAVLFILCIAALQTRCSDDLTEITEINYDRVFSPANLEALVINRTNVRLTWTKNSTTESYVIELFENDSLAFDGTPAITISDVTDSMIPYTVEELEGETRYSARVKGVSSATNDSKWSAVTFRTATEYILLPFENEDIAATSVTFRWPAGQSVTEIILEPGNIRHTVTADEVTEGVAIVSGLTGSTEYTVRVLNGAKVRATTTLTTLVDIGDAIAVYPEDDFVAMLAEAEDGYVFALFPGTYGEASTFTVSKNVGIKGVYPYNKPVLKGYFSLQGNSSLTLNAVTLDGEGLKDGNQAIVFSTADATYGDVLLEGCEVRNHVKGLYYLNVKASVESITINNCLMYNIECSGGDFMDSRTGAIRTITLSNSTIYNCALARDMIRYDNASGDFPNITTKIIVDRNTLSNVCNGTSRRLLYVRYSGHQITFTNNLVTETLGIFSNQDATGIPTFGNNNYFNAPGFLPGGSTTSKFFDTIAAQEDPGFKDPATGDFTVTNEVVKAREVGDPRWR